MKFFTRVQLQDEIKKLSKLGKLKRPLCEVLAYPNWMLIEVIKLRKYSN
jgi:hypothetical protein